MNVRPRTPASFHFAYCSDYLAALDHELHSFQSCAIRQRIAVHGNNVSPLPRLNRADFVGPAQQIGVVNGCCLDRLSGVRPSFTMTANSCALRPADTPRHRCRTRLSLPRQTRAPRSSVRPAKPPAPWRSNRAASQSCVFKKPIGEVERRHKISAVLFLDGDARVVDVGTVFESNPRPPPTPSGCPRRHGVRRDLAAEPVRIRHDGLHFFQRVLWAHCRHARARRRWRKF